MTPLHHRLRASLFAACCAALLCGCARESTSELLALSDQAIADGDARTALIHLRNVLEREPTNVEAITRVGKLYSVAGDARSAERFFRSAVRLGADPSEFRLEWLSAQLRTGRFAELIESTEPLPADLPAATVLGLRGYALQALGRLSDAEQSFRDAIAADPQTASGYADLAQLLLLLDQTEQADEQIGLALEREADFAPALVLLGMRQFSDGDSGAATATLSRAAESGERGYSATVWMSAM